MLTVATCFAVLTAAISPLRRFGYAVAVGATWPLWPVAVLLGLIRFSVEEVE